jgi:hypothetical protein
MNFFLGVLISLIGLIIVVTTLIALSVPQLRRVEVDLPDHDPALNAVPEAQPAALD